MPILLICGKKESANNSVTIRRLGSEKQENMKTSKFLKDILNANKLPL